MAKPKTSGIGTGGGAQTGAGVAGGGVGASAGGASAAGGSKSSLNLSDDDITKIKQITIIYGDYLKNGELSEEQYKLAMQALADNFGTDVKTLVEIKNGKFDKKKDEPEKKKQESKKKKTKTTSNNVDASKLPGINGNDFQPSANNKHLNYEGGGGLGIWNQLGGGVANGGVNSKTAKSMDDAVKLFTGSGYGKIRKAQANGDTTSPYGKKGVVLEQFISKAVETGNGWNGGPTYRGIDGISDSAYKYYASLTAGTVIDANHGGSASWSTNANTSFNGFSGGKNSVVFINTSNNQPMGVSVDKISTCKGEKEVLVSKEARFKVQHVAHYSGGTQKSAGMSSYTDYVGHQATDYLLVYVEPE